MSRPKGSKNKNTEIVEDVTPIQAVEPIAKVVPKSVSPATKAVPKSVIKPQMIEIDDNNDEEEVDDTNDIKNKAEVILSKDFKVIVTRNNKELLEKYMTKKTNEDGTEVDIEAWRSHGYPNTWKYIAKCVREIIGRNKMYEKGIVNGFDELLKILKESNVKISKMFDGLED